MNNYHTHTYRCGHATGDVADYVAAGREAGLRSVGMTDHVPFPDGLWAETRMRPEELDSYCDAVSATREAEARRPDGSGVDVLAGFECEWRPGYDDYLADLFRERKLDYLIGGVHWIPFEGEWLATTHITRPRELRIFTDYTMNTIKSGLFAFIAHPDIFCARWPEWNAESIACARAVLETAAETKTPLEINGYGLRKPFVNSAEGYRPQYPFDRFWELAGEYSIEVLVNSDAHRPQDVAAGLVEGRTIAEKFGLRVRDTLAFSEKHGRLT
jgi:histidinol-phosphatase (PHP family)